MVLTILGILQVLVYLVTIVTCLSEVKQLTGNPDYRYVTLKWEYDIDASHLYGFQVHYCELQAWGPHRCKAKAYDTSSINELVLLSRKSRLYSVIVPNLRMSTNYSFEVRPVASRRIDREYHDPKYSKTVLVSTKGFSAKASLCLPQESEIEVSTGPYFGGRIAVEAGDGERCTLDGDPNSPRDVYTLRINHDMCGSVVNDTTVTTFVLVQENLPILTHSTRRFMVVCTYQPDTLTVRAKISLPSTQSRHYHEDEHETGNRVDVEMHDERGNEVRMSRLLQLDKEESRARSNVETGEPIAQLVLMVVLVAVGAVGLILITWWTIMKRKDNAAKAESVDESERSESGSECSDSVISESDSNDVMCDFSITRVHI